jgi:hypothetical protein
MGYSVGFSGIKEVCFAFWSIDERQNGEVGARLLVLVPSFTGFH